MFIWGTSLTFPLFKAHFHQKMLKTGEMLKMFDLILKVLKTGEMLKMLKMLKFLGRTSDVKVGILRFPQRTLTSLTFPLF